MWLNFLWLILSKRHFVVGGSGGQDEVEFIYEGDVAREGGYPRAVEDDFDDVLPGGILGYLLTFGLETQLRRVGSVLHFKLGRGVVFHTGIRQRQQADEQQGGNFGRVFHRFFSFGWAKRIPHPLRGLLGESWKIGVYSG